MLNTEHYIDSIVMDESLSTDLHARLLTAAHRCISDGGALGVDWPEFISGKRFGRVMRVFGSKDDLAAYAAIVKPVENARLVMLFGPNPTPEAAEWRSFYRCRQSEDGTPAVEAYRAARAKRIGREYVPPTKARVVAKDYLKMCSVTTGQRYSLFIRLERTDVRPAVSKLPTGFALGGYVPHF